MPGGARRVARGGVARVALWLGVLSGVGCASLPAGGSAAGAPWSDDVVVLRAHRHVLAVAASARHVFALTTGGLVMRDRVFDRWVEPSPWLAAELRLAGVGDDGTPLGQAVLAADPLEDAAWIGVPGAVVIVRPRTSQAVRVTVAGTPARIVFARDGGDAWVLSSGRWARVSRGGFVSAAAGPPAAASVIVPADLEAVYREHPALRAQLPFLLRDAAASSAVDDGVAGVPVAARVRAGTLSPDRPGEAWIGTWGDGLWQVDARFLTAQPLPVGLPGDDVQAVWTENDAVWVAAFGPDGRMRVGVVAEPAPNDAPGRDGPSLEAIARDAAMTPHEAAQAAVARADAERLTGQRRVAHDSVVVLAAGRALRWRSVDGGDRPVALPAGVLAEVGPVVALALDAEWLWVAGPHGVFAVPRRTAFGSGDAGVPAMLRRGRELPAEVTSIALSSEMLWVGTRNGLVRVRRGTAGGIP